HGLEPERVAVVGAVELEVEIGVGVAGRGAGRRAVDRPLHHDRVHVGPGDALAAARADVVAALRVVDALAAGTGRQRTARQAGHQRETGTPHGFFFSKTEGFLHADRAALHRESRLTKACRGAGSLT